MSNLALGVLIGFALVFIFWGLNKVVKLFDDVCCLKNKVSYLENEAISLGADLRRIKKTFKEDKDVQSD